MKHISQSEWYLRRQCCISYLQFTLSLDNPRVNSNENKNTTKKISNQNECDVVKASAARWTVIPDKTALKQTLFIHFLRDCITIFSLKLRYQTWNTKHTVHTYWCTNGHLKFTNQAKVATYEVRSVIYGLGRSRSRLTLTDHWTTTVSRSSIQCIECFGMLTS